MTKQRYFQTWQGASSCSHIQNVKTALRKLGCCLFLASMHILWTKLTFLFYTVSIEHLSEVFREILFDLSRSKHGRYRSAQVCAYELQDFNLVASVETPPVESETLLNTAECRCWANRSWLCLRMSRVYLTWKCASCVYIISTKLPN